MTSSSDNSSAGYSPSPRPVYDAPTLIKRTAVRTHIWGDRESGLVADWLYASTDKLHVLLFGLAPGRWFKHSPAYRTVFAADEVLYVLSGSMLASNPETGEVLQCERGESLFFRRDTWHHVQARGEEPLRILEFFAPPPATGSSGVYAQQQPYLEKSKYARDEILGGATYPARSTLKRLTKSDQSLRVEGDLTVGIIVSSEHLTVADIEVAGGAQGLPTKHDGDALLFGLHGEVMIRARWQGSSFTFETGVHDGVFLPHGCSYEVLSFGRTARLLLGVAPRYLHPWS